ncbi:MAG: hypothetical protein KDN22_00840 [Verrucomicrobiae bacterium]|nr:hypothetical protein [Verrucomicrobiae bacterium]
MQHLIVLVLPQTIVPPSLGGVFRVGDADARSLASGFADFDVRDIQSLEIGEAICRVGRSDHDFNLRVPLPDTVDPDIARTRRERVMDASRRRHATPREEVERELFGD